MEQKGIAHDLPLGLIGLTAKAALLPNVLRSSCVFMNYPHGESARIDN